MTSTFTAWYEDARLAEAEARANGWTDDNDSGSLLDNCVIESPHLHTARAFATQAEAVAWVQFEINGLHTVFGCGTVVQIELTPRAERCDYCTCNGRKPVRQFTVTDEGIEDDSVVDDCNNDF